MYNDDDHTVLTPSSKIKILIKFTKQPQGQFTIKTFLHYNTRNKPKGYFGKFISQFQSTIDISELDYPLHININELSCKMLGNLISYMKLYGRNCAGQNHKFNVNS